VRTQQLQDDADDILATQLGALVDDAAAGAIMASQYKGSLFGDLLGGMWDRDWGEFLGLCVAERDAAMMRLYPENHGRATTAEPEVSEEWDLEEPETPAVSKKRHTERPTTRTKMKKKNMASAEGARNKTGKKTGKKNGKKSVTRRRRRRAKKKTEVPPRPHVSGDANWDTEAEVVEVEVDAMGDDGGTDAVATWGDEGGVRAFNQEAMYHIEASTRPAFVRVDPTGCDSPECAAIATFWKASAGDFPGISLWAGSCSDPALWAFCKDRGVQYLADVPSQGGGGDPSPVFDVWAGTAWRRYAGAQSAASLREYLTSEAYLNDVRESTYCIARNCESSPRCLTVPLILHSSCFIRNL
jgi:hypothetical protein